MRVRVKHIIFIAEQLVGKYRVLWLDLAPYLKRQVCDSETPCLQPALLSAIASSEHKLALSWCSGALSTLTLSSPFISLQGQCWAYTPSKPSRANQPDSLLCSRHRAALSQSGLYQPLYHPDAPLMSLWLHHSTPSFGTPTHCCLCWHLCQAQVVQAEQHLETVTSAKQATCQGWATHCKAPLNLKCLF